MNLLSIDVGIKNLACCSLCIDNNDYTIKSWDINLYEKVCIDIDI